MNYNDFFPKKLNISAGTTDRKNCVNLVVKMKSSRLASGKLLYYMESGNSHWAKTENITINDFF